MSGEKKFNKTIGGEGGKKSIAQYFLKTTNKAGITQEAETTPSSLQHSDRSGIAEGAASEVERHHNRKDEENI